MKNIPEWTPNAGDRLHDQWSRPAPREEERIVPANDPGGEECDDCSRERAEDI